MDDDASTHDQSAVTRIAINTANVPHAPATLAEGLNRSRVLRVSPLKAEVGSEVITYNSVTMPDFAYSSIGGTTTLLGSNGSSSSSSAAFSVSASLICRLRRLNINRSTMIVMSSSPSAVKNTVTGGVCFRKTSQRVRTPRPKTRTPAATLFHRLPTKKAAPTTIESTYSIIVWAIASEYGGGTNFSSFCKFPWNK